MKPKLASATMNGRAVVEPYIASATLNGRAIVETESAWVAPVSYTHLTLQTIYSV